MAVARLGPGASGGAGSAWAILAAAGEGRRLGAERPKAFVGLAGRPLLAESLARLDGSEWIDAIVVVAAPGWEEPTILLAEELVAAKVVAVVTGAATRPASVRAGLEEVDADALVVLVHDAARPLITDDVIGRVVAPLAEGYDGVVPAIAVPDTLKRVQNGVVAETIARAGLVAVQTPQAFRADVLKGAFAAGDLGDVTDCASVVEKRGGRIRVVEGDPTLLKVTSPADLELVERLLAS